MYNAPELGGKVKGRAVQDREKIGQGQVKSQRKSYAKPTIKRFGSVSDLTMGGAASTRSDHGSNTMRP